MARKENISTVNKEDKKLRTKDLIFAGAFGAIYIVVMLMVVMVCGIVPILYILSPFIASIRGGLLKQVHMKNCWSRAACMRTCQCCRII